MVMVMVVVVVSGSVGSAGGVLACRAVLADGCGRVCLENRCVRGAYICTNFRSRLDACPPLVRAVDGCGIGGMCAGVLPELGWRAGGLLPVDMSGLVARAEK